MRYRNTSKSNRLHPSISISKRVQLHLHLDRLRSVEYALNKTPLDILFHKERKLQRQADASII